MRPGVYEDGADLRRSRIHDNTTGANSRSGALLGLIRAIMVSVQTILKVATTPLQYSSLLPKFSRRRSRLFWRSPCQEMKIPVPDELVGLKVKDEAPCQGVHKQ